ncbi:MAG: ASPIC/UnbV domain-containing protein, partial [Myxococcales bacterium]|nr:ASPIC/UnbV domain-containing protein [Myxococcales bacterium]
DGDLDLVVAASLWRTCTEEWGGIPEVRFYENDASELARGVSIRLAGDGTTTNRTAIGARVTVRAGDLSLVRIVDGGHGHSAMQDDTVVSFGINGCTTIDAVEVRWPNQARDTQIFENVPASTLLEITQGAAAPVVVLP